MKRWETIKNLLCIRPDNMGDVIMSGPAFRAMKETFGCKITLLTSSMGAGIVPFMPEVDEAMICDLPWVKTACGADASSCMELVDRIRQKSFDAAVVFTVYSQNPLPSAMLAYLAGVPRRLAYCRENPYELLTDWIPDPEPYQEVLHQVARDVQLVQYAGAQVGDAQFRLDIPDADSADRVLRSHGVSAKNFIVIHPSVSEDKRRFPDDLWIELLHALRDKTELPFLITGGTNERGQAENLIRQADISACYNVAGETDLPAFLQLIDKASLLLSVNTSAIHIAAATQTPTVVLYAATNPQHTPWMVPSRVFYYGVPAAMQSRNEVIRYANNRYFEKNLPYPGPEDVAAACVQLLEERNAFASRLERQV